MVSATWERSRVEDQALAFRTRLQVASRFGRKTPCLPDNVAPGGATVPPGTEGRKR